MIVAGIDVGSLTTKIVIMEDNKVLNYNIISSGEEGDVEAQKGIENLGFFISDIKTIVATGVGRKSVLFAHKYKTTLSCLSKGALFLFPNAKTIVDVGAESSTIVTINEKGGLEDFSTSDKCASGTGIFLQSMAKLLQISLEEMGNISLSANGRADISGVCAVFAEQEVISHLHRDPPTPLSDVVAGIYYSIVSKVITLSKKLEIKPDIILTGGVAKSPGFVKIFEEEIGFKVYVPYEPQILSALGAACIA